MNEKFQTILDFIRELYHQPDGFIPLHAPVFAGNEKKYLEECIDTTFVSSVGKFVDEFEVKMAEYTGVTRAVACVNGTSALHLALKLVGVQKGHEVITQPLTFVATANAIAYCDAQPVFLDVDTDTMGLSPHALLTFLDTQTHVNSSTNQCINNATNRPISACLPMHTFGHPCRIDEIVDICDSYCIPVVEDAAESLGSYYRNKHTGTFGKIGTLSFNGNKIITTGGGGMLLFNDEHLAKYAKHLTTQAKVTHPYEFVHNEIGYNFRMPNINAALGLAQLEKIQDFLESKHKIAALYNDFFKGTSITYVIEPSGSVSNYWLNCILFEKRFQRDEFLEYSNSNGIMTRPAWKLMNELPMFQNCQTVEISNSIDLADRLVNIPSSVIIKRGLK